MRKTVFFFLVSVISFSGRPAFAFQPDSFAGAVTAVYDGDTIQVRLADGTLEKVRLIGVDTPEMDDAREDVLFWAVMAKRFVFHHLYGKNVRLSFDRERRDKYGRLLAYVWTDGGRLFNELLIREGYAAAYLAFPFEKKRQDAFREAEKEARRLQKGKLRKEDPPVVAAGDAAEAAGQVVTLTFTCSEVKVRKKYIYLSAGEGPFEAVIPEEKRSLFPDSDSYNGRPISVTGFLEIFRGRPQIMVVLPRQIRIQSLTSRRFVCLSGTRSCNRSEFLSFPGGSGSAPRSRGLSRPFCPNSE